jgi:hypothetical protein
VNRPTDTHTHRRTPTADVLARACLAIASKRATQDARYIISDVAGRHVQSSLLTAIRHRHGWVHVLSSASAVTNRPVIAF